MFFLREFEFSRGFVQVMFIVMFLRAILHGVLAATVSRKFFCQFLRRNYSCFEDV